MKAWTVFVVLLALGMAFLWIPLILGQMPNPNRATGVFVFGGIISGIAIGIGYGNKLDYKGWAK